MVRAILAHDLSFRRVPGRVRARTRNPITEQALCPERSDFRLNHAESAVCAETGWMEGCWNGRETPGCVSVGDFGGQGELADARYPLRISHAAQVLECHTDCGRDAGTRHRRKYGHLFRGGCRDSKTPAVRRRGTARFR